MTRFVFGCAIFFGLSAMLAAQEEKAVLIERGEAIGFHLDVGEWYARRAYVEGRGERNYLFAKKSPAGETFRIRARLRLLEQRGSAASFFLDGNHFGFEGAGNTLFVNGPLFGGLKLLGSPDDSFPRGEWFDFEVRAEKKEIRFLLGGKEAHRVRYSGRGFQRMGFSPWRAQMQIESFVLFGDAKPYTVGTRPKKKASLPRAKNVLFISVDDLRPVLGCYGSKLARTPNLDRLARQGVVFERAYCQFALCNPSRTSLLTGMRPDRVGVVGNHVHFRDRHPDVVTLPQHFKNHGYATHAVGKIYHGVFPTGASVQPADTMGDLSSWSARPYRPGPRYYYTEDGIAQAKTSYRRMYKVTDPAPHDWTSRLVFGPMTEAPDVEDAELYDGEVTERALARLRKHREEPFFLAVGFIKPHTPFVAPKRYWDLYDPRDFDFASRSTLPDDAPGLAGHGSGEIRRYTDQPNRGAFTPENERRLRHGYFACVSYIDGQIGRLLDELDRLELREKTIVVVYGDHGFHLGEHGLWGKVTNFELATRVPLIVSAPGLSTGGRAESLTELLDLYPTLSDLAGLPRPGHLEGESFVSVLGDPSKTIRTAAFSQMTRGKTMGYSVRVDGLRYTEWVDRRSGRVEARELYEYEKESNVETRNLAGRPERSAQVAELSRRLDSVLSNGSRSDLSFARVFQDHMVLQRELPIAIWGKTKKGERVAVELDGVTATTTADDGGRWRVTLPPRAASKDPLVLVARTVSTRVEIRDVLVGEVWLAAGQSNMEWPLAKSKGTNEVLAKSNREHLRLFRFQGAARGGSGVYSSDLIARLRPEVFCEGAWKTSTPESAGPFSAVAYHFGRSLLDEIDVPIGLIDVSIGGTPIEAWIRPEALRADPNLRSIVEGNWLDNADIEEWCRQRARFNLERALESGESIPGDELGPNHSFKPGFLWRSGVEPLLPMVIRGVLWYQGESNAEGAKHVSRYGRLFETLAADWRRAFRREGLPILFVQLPALGRPHWPAFREVQRRALESVPASGMAITIDTGDKRNVHPIEKRVVGERLARLALATSYDRGDGDASGPLPRVARRELASVVVEFAHVESGWRSTSDRPLRYFELAGTDGEFHPATARIRGSAIVVSSPKVPQPKRVRYAWLPFPEPRVNLFNASGLPASPFVLDVEEN